MNEFRTWQVAACQSPGTIRLYRWRLEYLATLTTSPGKVTREMLLGILANPAWEPNTRKSARAAWRTFFGWALDAGYVRRDPTIGLPKISVPRAVPRPAPDHVVAVALENAGGGHRRASPGSLGTALDVELMLMLGAYGGLRCVDMCRVHERDLIGSDLRVLGKGNKVRMVPVSGDLLARLQTVRGYAFPNTQRGGHVTAGHISRTISRALPDGWTAHTLRHRFATTVHSATGDLLTLMELLGHSKPETTMTYVLLPDDRRRAAAHAAQVSITRPPDFTPPRARGHLSLVPSA